MGGVAASKGGNEGRDEAAGRGQASLATPSLWWRRASTFHPHPPLSPRCHLRPRTPRRLTLPRLPLHHRGDHHMRLGAHPRARIGSRVPGPLFWLVSRQAGRQPVRSPCRLNSEALSPRGCLHVSLVRCVIDVIRSRRLSGAFASASARMVDVSYDCRCRVRERAAAWRVDVNENEERVARDCRWKRWPQCSRRTGAVYVGWTPSRRDRQ